MHPPSVYADGHTKVIEGTRWRRSRSVFSHSRMSRRCGGLRRDEPMASEKNGGGSVLASHVSRTPFYNIPGKKNLRVQYNVSANDRPLEVSLYRCSEIHTTVQWSMCDSCPLGNPSFLSQSGLFRSYLYHWQDVDEVKQAYPV